MIDLVNQPLQYNLQWRNAFLSDLAGMRNTHRIGYGGFNWYIGFGTGTFDTWAAIAFMVDANGYCWKAFAKDTFYFELIQRIHYAYASYPQLNIYKDLCRIYDAIADKELDENGNYIDTQVDPVITDLIHRISSDYGVDGPIVETALFHIYYGMIAEENKANAKLGKTVKLVGLYDLLYGCQDIQQATSCLCTKDDDDNTGWDVIYAKALQSGIIRTKLMRTSDDQLNQVHYAIREAIIDQRPYTSIFNGQPAASPDIAAAAPIPADLQAPPQQVVTAPPQVAAAATPPPAPPVESPVDVAAYGIQTTQPTYQQQVEAANYRPSHDVTPMERTSATDAAQAVPGGFSTQPVQFGGLQFDPRERI